MLVARAIDADANALKSLASTIARQPGRIVVLVSTSAPPLVAVARSADLAGVSAQKILAALLARYGGRGGGKAELAQGGGLNASAHEIVAATPTVL
jgi:alanyl-tRNA synthetase